ncbi:RB1-inducible coiled-coil protein 1-like [Dysidea avara]|uniref:RB1-inducible coiled-coil protein 1-like n=1 Tax=Dysidea avara TaxID=196820 RepID=UPI003332CFF3
MLCVFQVNQGKFLTVSDEVQPNSRVNELSSTLARYHGIAEDKQVLLTHQGQLLERQEMIGAYGAGTETKPLLLYDMSLIQGDIHPHRQMVAELGENYDQGLNAMRQSNGDIKQQITLAKRLAASCDVLNEKCALIIKEQTLQLQGWAAAVANSNTVLENFVKQVKLLKENTENFVKSKNSYQKLLDNFPQVLELLKQMTLPTQLLSEHINHTSHTPTLLDWIGTHDQSSTLSDLAKECRSALESHGEERMNNIITEAESAIASVPDQNKALEEWKAKMSSNEQIISLKRAETLAEEVKDFVKKFMATSERALKSGEKSVVKDITLSNWQTLSMMSKQHSELQSVVKECISCKEQLTAELNQQLKLVSEAQTKVSDSERHIPLLKERMRRINQRFTILGQINDAPKILVCAIGEVVRRKRFHQQFIKLTDSTTEQFKTIRSDEIKLRKGFISENGQHFLMQLFQQAFNDRPPEFASSLHRHFDLQLPEISAEEIQTISAIVTPELQQILSNAMSFTVEGATTVSQPVTSQPVKQFVDSRPVDSRPVVSRPQDEVDASMYTSASENESQFEEISKLETEKKELEQEMEQLKLHNAQLASSSETLEKKLAALSEEKVMETEKLEQQLQYMTEKQNESQRNAMEVRLSNSSRFEEKDKQIEKLQTSMEALQQELLQCKQQVEVKDKLLHEEQTESQRKIEEERLSNSSKFEEKNKQIEALKTNMEALQQELLQCKQLAEEKDKLLHEQQTESQRKVLEERLSHSRKFETKDKEIEVLKESVDNLQQQLQQCIQKFQETEREQKLKIEKQKSDISVLLKQQKKMESLPQELLQYKQSIEEKDKLLQEQALKIDDQSSEITQLQEQHIKDTKLKDTLLESKGKDIRDLNKKLEIATEKISAEKTHQQKLDTEKQKLEEELSKLKQELHKVKADNEELKSKCNTTEVELQKYNTQVVEELHQLKSIHQEKSETLDRTEKELSQKLEELKSENSSLRKDKEQLNVEVKRLNSEISTKNSKLTELSSSVVNLENKLSDCVKEHHIKENTFLAEKEKTATEIKKLQETVDKSVQDESLMKTIFKNQLDDKERKLTELKTVQENLEKELEEETTKLTAENEVISSKLREYEENYKKAVQAEAEAIKEITKCKSDGLLEKEHNSKEVKKLQTIIAEKDKVIEQQKSTLEQKVDLWQKKYMEIERDYKESQRVLEKSSTEPIMFTSTSSCKELTDSTIVPSVEKAPKPNALSPSVPSAEAPLKPKASSWFSVNVLNLQVGDIALFYPDKHGNYFAVTVDSKVYYLDKKSSGTFTTHHEACNKIVKLLVGKVTGRVHCEVKKDGNRLRVPMGSQVYRLTADEWKV